MRNTKIICTIGPATASFEKLKELSENGMNIARLNMSHGTHEWHRSVIQHIKRLNKKLGGSLAILLDTRGPEVRTGDVNLDLLLKKGDALTLTVRRQAVLEKNTVEVNYDGFVDEVEVGDTVLIDGGMISLKVLRISDKDIFCQCLDDGILTSRRHINIRGKSADLPSITAKDWEDIRFGIENGVDFIALSFIRTAETISELRKTLKCGNECTDILAKIESAAAIPHLDEIIDRADGIMIARGDLGAELPFEEVPLLQEEIIRKCRAAGKPVVVATHMLESMIVNPTPTRAEVTDITHAVLQGADATMLSGETATGKYPLRALAAMDTVTRRIERKLTQDTTVRMAPSENPKHEIARSAAILNNNLHGSAILVFTRRGLMAMLLSRCRPGAPIYAFTNTTHVRRRLEIFWGVHPFLIKLSKDPEVSIKRAIDKLLHRQLLAAGARVIVVSDILVDGKFVETVQVRII